MGSKLKKWRKGIDSVGIYPSPPRLVRDMHVTLRRACHKGQVMTTHLKKFMTTIYIYTYIYIYLKFTTWVNHLRLCDVHAAKVKSWQLIWTKSWQVTWNLLHGSITCALWLACRNGPLMTTNLRFTTWVNDLRLCDLHVAKVQSWQLIWNLLHGSITCALWLACRKGEA